MTTAAEAAAAISEAERTARKASAAAYQDETAARNAQYAATEARRIADEAAETAAAELRDLIRALANRSETAPYEVEPESERDPRGRHYAATFGRAYVNVRSSSGRWSSKPQPQIASAYIVRSGQSQGETVYQSPRGTSDAAKVEAETGAARAAAIEALRPLTAAAFLTARGIDPQSAPDPEALIEAVPNVGQRSDSWGNGGTWWDVSWYAALRSTGEAITQRKNGGAQSVNAWDVTEARADAKAGGRYKATVEARNAEREADRLPTEATKAEAEAWANERNAEALALLVARL